MGARGVVFHPPPGPPGRDPGELAAGATAGTPGAPLDGEEVVLPPPVLRETATTRLWRAFRRPLGGRMQFPSCQGDPGHELLGGAHEKGSTLEGRSREMMRVAGGGWGPAWYEARGNTRCFSGGHHRKVPCIVCGRWITPPPPGTENRWNAWHGGVGDGDGPGERPPPSTDTLPVG